MSNSWQATVLTLFPEMFPGPLGISLLGKALEKNLWRLDVRDIREHVDIVDIFRRSEYLPQIVEDAIAIGADVVWAQLGIINRAAAQRAQQAGLGVVMDRCMAIEHRRLMRMVESVLY